MKEFITIAFRACFLVMAVTASAYGLHSQKFVKYCSLFDSNQGKTVISKALMFYSTVERVDGSDTFLYSSDCNGPDFFAIPQGNSEIWKKWDRFFDNLPSEKNHVLEITFEGKSDVATAYLFGSLDGWARAQMILSKILSIREVTNREGAQARWEAAKPKVERIERMRAVLDIFVTSLYSPSNTEQGVSDHFSDEFRFVDLTGKMFRKDQYQTLYAPWATSAAQIEKSRMSRRLINSAYDTVKWRATFDIVFKAAPSKTYYCDVTLVWRDSRWIIHDAVMVTKP